MTVILHTPEAVRAFRAALDDYDLATLEAARDQLQRFKDEGRSYFEDGDAGVFTYHEIVAYIRDREATLRRFARELKADDPEAYEAWADVSGYEKTGDDA